MPRQARLDVPGTLHHVIIRGIERNKIVADDRDRRYFVERLAELSVDLETSIYAWALMTNHAHLLIRSGPAGLSNFMRKLLTGYAIFYNKRHKRFGYLFQNRYKSIVCEEDSYFRELVRYIHLNPLRGKLVDTLQKLDRYGWCGHSVVMGRIRNNWQDRKYVLGWFGTPESTAKRIYRQFVKNGISMGRQPHLVGGGLIRSIGGWSQVKALRRIGDRQVSDERILGSGDFVEQVTKELDLLNKYRVTAKEREKNAIMAIRLACKENGISIKALQNGSRRRKVTQVRGELSARLVDEYGLTLAETARQVGVTTSAVARTINRRKENKYKK